jgi:phage/plasmid-like protein (TIGR03299 family)
MAHNINFNETTGKHSFFSVAQKAWHGLGQIVSEYPTSREAIQFAGLDYRVEKRRLFTFDNDNSFGNADTVHPTVEVPSYFATVRADSDAVLGVVGNDYQVVQNVDAFSFFDAIVGGEGILYETAGALGKGERIFITAKLPDYIRVGSDDLIEKYLFLTTSHDGFGAITAAFTPVRIVCANTLNAALHNHTHSIKIRHTANAQQRLQQAHKLIGISNQLSTELEELFNQWTKVRITDPEVKKLISLALAPSKEALQGLGAEKKELLSKQFQNTCEAAFAYAMSNPTQVVETTKGTLFGAYNAVTGYYQNVRSYRDEEAKLKSIVLGGTAQQRSTKAFRLCSDFMRHGRSALHLN